MQTENLNKDQKAGKKNDGILAQIIRSTEKNIERRRLKIAEEVLSRRAHSMPETRDFIARLQNPPANQEPRIIAEIKKASPSKDIIRENFAPLELARELNEAGADALSVLTEPHFFQGSLRYLRIIADNTDLPILCKDFIITPYQIYEARLAGADAVLLIAAALSQEQIIKLTRVARAIGLTVLTEVHNQQELNSVLKAEPPIIGVNSRDLNNFETDLNRTAELLKKIPPPIVRVAESGIHGPADIEQLLQAGADAFLVGENLMRNPRPGHQLRKLKSTV